jgi:hypothetical protein
MATKKVVKVKEPKAIKSGHTKPKVPIVPLDQPGRLRVSNMMAILNVGHSTFMQGVKSGRYPPPDGRDGSFLFWNNSTGKKCLIGNTEEGAA